MSALYLFSDKDAARPLLQTCDQGEIAQLLAAEGVRFEQWRADFPVGDTSTGEEVLRAYTVEIDRLKAQGGYRAADVINMYPEHPEKETLRRKFLDEHRHAEDEVRFFVRGDGLFYLHLEDRVAAVQCCAGDLISVPANTRHWFDMGDSPSFTAIRIFTNPEGWVAEFTGDDIAATFPRYEALAV